MKIKSWLKEYEVDFANSFTFFGQLFLQKNIFVIIDSNVYGLYKKQLEEFLLNTEYYILDAVEENKSIDEVLKIADKMVNLPSKKNTNLISIGGGIVQDVSGFIANILYRGIRWTWIPTTLLAQTDSCIGSKTSLNYKKYKNLFGTFYPPDQINICIQFIHTLTKKDYLSGLGEIYKISIMRGNEAFRESADYLPLLLERDEDTLLSQINKTLYYKKKLIEEDEFDKGVRNLLNYGHTFGHALESVSNYAIPHGQSVTVGVLMANSLAYSRGYITREKKEEIEGLLAHIYQKELLQSDYFLAERFITAMRKDKKFTGQLHTCILLTMNGVKKFTDVTDSEIDEVLELWR